MSPGGKQIVLLTKTTFSLSIICTAQKDVGLAVLLFTPKSGVMGFQVISSRSFSSISVIRSLDSEMQNGASPEKADSRCCLLRKIERYKACLERYQVWKSWPMSSSFEGVILTKKLIWWEWIIVRVSIQILEMGEVFFKDMNSGIRTQKGKIHRGWIWFQPKKALKNSNLKDLLLQDVVGHSWDKLLRTDQEIGL